MSRIGRKPLEIPKGVQVSITKDAVSVKGPKGTLNVKRQGTTAAVDVKQAKDEEQKDVLVFERKGNLPNERAAHGLMRALVANMVKGVTDGFTRELEINGVGYKAEIKGSKHRALARVLAPDRVQAARGITAKTDKNLLILVGHRQAGARRAPPRRSAASVRPSPTRARASSTKKRRSCVKRARRQVSSHVLDTSSSAARRRASALQAQGHDPQAHHRHRGAPAAVRVPLGEARLRAGDRRHHGPRARGGVATSRPSVKAGVAGKPKKERARAIGKAIGEKLVALKRQVGRVRPQRVHLSRSRQRSGRRSPRSGSAVLRNIEC